ncbi:MAG: hypothetical protein FJ095_19270 [Deltaproteobacteria bacterium]|nr:hypothetical protein [Deltaproteobacteria bacterium]
MASETEPAAIGVDAALDALQFKRESPGVAACLAEIDDPRRVRCLIALRYAADPQALKLAVELHDRLGDVAGLAAEHDMNGGWRGPIHLVPELPIGARRRHLQWVAEARFAIAEFFTKLSGDAPSRPTFGHRPLTLLFTRSVGKSTPSAYAFDWKIAYNVEGSLHRSADAVRETMFHENFHLADQAHSGWSERALGPLHDELMRRCDVERKVVASRVCLRPYAPHSTTVLGGTYYAFHPGNGVGEYAAELAVRYYEEHLAALAGKAFTTTPFKCGPPENGRAWRLLVDEFFAGIDRTPACSR